MFFHRKSSLSEKRHCSNLSIVLDQTKKCRSVSTRKFCGTFPKHDILHLLPCRKKTLIQRYKDNEDFVPT